MRLLQCKVLQMCCAYIVDNMSIPYHSSVQHTLAPFLHHKLIDTGNLHASVFSLLPALSIQEALLQKSPKFKLGQGWQATKV